MRAAQTRPYVVINMAMTADGKIATANRVVSSFGTPRDLEHLYALRATADAVLCGAGTVNDPEVTLGSGGDRFERQRRRGGLGAHALRVVVTGGGSLSLESGVFRPSPAPLVILTTRRAPASLRREWRARGAVVRLCGSHTVNLEAALNWLATDWGVRRLICEGGGQLNDAMLRGGWVDELRLTLCPKLVGGRRAPTIAEGQGVERLADAQSFRLTEVNRRGDELYLKFLRTSAA